MPRAWLMGATNGQAVLVDPADPAFGPAATPAGHQGPCRIVAVNEDACATPSDKARVLGFCPKYFYSCAWDGTSMTCDGHEAAVGAVNGASCTEAGDLCAVAAAGGLYMVKTAGWSVSAVDQAGTAPVLSAAVSGASAADPDLVVLATSEAHFYRFSAAGVATRGKARWTTDWMHEIFYGPNGTETVTDAAFAADGTAFLGAPGAVYSQDARTSFRRLDSRVGLPYNRTTSVSCGRATAGDATCWFGTAWGLVRYDPAPPSYGVPDGVQATPLRRFLYFNGPRWLVARDAMQPNNTVLSVSATPQAGETGALALTPMGVAYVHTRNTTLEAKMAVYETYVPLRHDRFGLVSDSQLAEFGDLSTSHTESSDNDGLWTSVYLAAMSFKYAVTRDPADKAAALHHFGGMELLNNVTGVTGLMARSVLPRSTPYSGGTWHNSSTDPSLKWKGDTSSDEVTGHMQVYPLVYDLVAETDEERERPRRLVLDIVSYIVRNGYYLIDVTGKPTTWGRWSPADLNRNISYYDERGVNSAQILSYLLSAERLAGNESALYTQSLAYLLEDEGYDRNLVNAKIVEPSDDNFSDDELLNLPYHLIAWTALRHRLAGTQGTFETDPYLQGAFNASIERSFNVTRSEKHDLWNQIYGAYTLGPQQGGGGDGGGRYGDQVGYPEDRMCPVFSTATPFSLGDSVHTMRSWPAELIGWNYHNSHRLDVPVDPYSVDGRSRSPESQPYFVLPPQERRASKDNDDPFTLDGGNGMNENDPGAIMLAYWYGRYHGFISSPDSLECSSPAAARA